MYSLYSKYEAPAVTGCMPPAAGQEIVWHTTRNNVLIKESFRGAGQSGTKMKIKY